MSHRLACWSGVVCLALGLPSAALGQNRKPCGASSTSSSVPNMSIPGMSIPSGPRFSIPSPPSFRIPTGPGGFNMPPALRRGFQPNAPLAPQLAIQQNLQFQQGLMQQVQQQWMLQDMVKQQLLRFAIDAPAENLQRELKNSNAFVRWAASVELNRRWKLESALRDSKRDTATVARIEVPAAPARLRSATPATVTPVSQSLALSVPFAEDRQELFQRSIPTP